jgi:DNA replication protein DnaC
MRVPGFRLEHLGTLVRAHRFADTVGRVVAWILRADLIVVDDAGLLEVAADAAYEKRSIAVSSNLHPAGFESVIPKNPATATVDRLLAHAQVGQTSGDSIRLTRALAVKGVTAMN